MDGAGAWGLEEKGGTGTGKNNGNKTKNSADMYRSNQ
jgi:hypothetical protein